MVRVTYFMLVLIFQLSLLSSSLQNNWKYLDLSCNEGNVSLDALHIVSNGTIITLGNCTYTLALPLTISAVQGLHIIGNDSVIDCTGDNAGMTFKMVSDFLLEKLTIRHCGMYLSEDKLQIASVQIMNSSKVDVRNVIIENGTGTGLSLVNVGGNVTVKDCTFRHNKYQAYQSYRVLNTTHNDFSQRGGGMQILIQNSTGESVYRILRCSFTFNFASSGGGLFVVIQYGPHKIDIFFTRCNFSKNTCTKGGGGVQVGYTAERGQRHNSTADNIVFKRCVFKSNEGGYGGGISIFSSLGSPRFTKNKLNFIYCSWSQNIAAKNGMAVDVAIASWEILPRYGHHPKLQFQKCNFADHSNTNLLNSLRSIFSVVEFEVKFSQQITFENNNGTAIDATAAVLSINKKAKINFRNNRGINGGAIRLKGLSIIVVGEGSTLVFHGNSAVKKGGAIHVNSLHEHFSTCFIRYQKQAKKNANFIFANNTAGFQGYGNRGNSIYASSFHSCLEKCSHASYYNISLSKALECIGKFEFDDINLGRQFTSAPHHFSAIDTTNIQDNLCDIYIRNTTIYSKPLNRVKKIYNHINETMLVIPGRGFKIPLKLVDELCEEVVFHVSVEVLESRNGSMFMKNSLITKNYITVYGNPHDYGILQFSAIGVRDVTLSVQLDNCPPGYIHSKIRCVCSLTTQLHYPGIERCSKLEYKAYVKHGYWLGYLNNQATQETLASAICPRGFCWARNATEHPLPSVAKLNISSFICKNRTGIICGSCDKNYSTYYRSASFSCDSIQLCYLGWLFYIVSEIFPVTVLFFIVIYFNISFTSGALNGVILFMQIVDTLKTDGENSIQFGDTVRQFSRIYKIVYRVFLLKFFAIEELSFCLWEGATALDMLAFRYVTIVYSLFLVIITVIMLRKCTCRYGKVKGLKIIKPSFNLKHSILNGLSAFLVMSYSECTRVTLMILTTGTLTVGPIKSIYTSYKYESVAFYNGNFQYMSPEHLKYALPAIVFLLTLVALPPILLIVYPLCYKLFALLKIDESKFVKIVCQVIPLEKIKPLFDSIQSEFKDQYRFFAGLYFIYRLTTSLTFTFVSALKTYYSATCVQLTVMLVLHAICCPYKERWHNVLDALMFADLAVINAISSFNYASSNQSVIVNLAGLQCGLILLPLIYFVVYTIYNIVMKIKAKMTLPEYQDDTLKNDNNSNDVLEMLDTRSFEDSDNYILLNES